MARTATVSSITLGAPPEPDRDDNLKRAVEMIDQCACDQPDLIVLPEVFTKLGIAVMNPSEWAEPLDGPTVTALAERARVNLGWDGARLGSPTIALPGQAMPLRKALEHVASQTRIGRFHMEPGRGIWAYLDGDRRLFARSGAVPWDRAVVRAYDVRRLLGRRSPQAIVGALRKQVDPTQWESGLPAAAVFVPTRRLIVVHDEPGQRRVRAVLDEMAVGRIRGIEEPKKKAQP